MKINICWRLFWFAFCFGAIVNILEIYINREKIASGRVEGHDRRTGWKGLINDLDKAKDDGYVVDEQLSVLLKRTGEGDGSERPV